MSYIEEARWPGTRDRQSATRTSPQTVVLSLFGRYVLPLHSELPMDGLIRAMEPLGFRQGSVRALASRMKQRGLLSSRKEGRYSFYQLTESGLKQMQSNNRPHSSSTSDTWDNHWTLVVYSVPEQHRELRDAFRSCLSNLGFGTIAPGAWISPFKLTPDTEDIWHDLSAKGLVEVFRAQHRGPSDPGSLVWHAWPQLHRLESLYLGYVDRYGPVLNRYECGSLDNEQCFCTCVRSYCEFVQTVAGDPRLPAALLPEDWPYADAQSLFQEIQNMLSDPAACFFSSVCETPRMDEINEGNIDRSSQ